MTCIIGAQCIDLKDRSCVDVCPVDCIHEFDRMLIIDPEECIMCGACEPECPMEAILPEDALPADWAPFVRINYAYGEGAAVVNALVEDWLDGDDGTAGVREPRNPPPKTPGGGEALDLPR